MRLNRFRRYSATPACLLLAISLMIGGCAARQKNITNLPAGVTATQVQNWDTAVANLDKIANVVSTTRQTVIALNKAGVLPDGPIYGQILTSLGKIDQAEQDAVTYLKAQPQNWNISTQQKVQNDVTLIQQELSTMTTQQLVGIKSASAQSQVQQLITQLGSFVAIILSLV